MRMVIILLSLCLLTSVRAQVNVIAPNLKDSFMLVRTAGDHLNDFAVDNLGYLYLVSDFGHLKKLSPKGDSVAVFNDVRRFGKLYSIDVSNPLKVLLFYKDFGTIVVLDRMLNNRNIIDVRKQNILQAKAIAQSYDNGVWVYDEPDGKLKRLDDNGTVISETADFRMLFSPAPSPLYIADADRLVYLYDPEKGLFVLDYFGTVRNKVALLGWTDMQVIGNRVVGRKGNTLESYTPGTLVLREQQLPEMLSGVSKAQLSMDYLYCLRNGVVHIYSLSNH